MKRALAADAQTSRHDACLTARMKPDWRTVVTTLLATIAVTAVVALVGPYTGLLDVSADSRPSAVAAWFLGATRRHSVSFHAARIAVPDLSAPARIAEGAEHYRDMCAGCHGAPGVERDEIGKGLEPRPPSLSASSCDDERARTTFWIVKHGIRMTGMPAFGRTHSDKKIWDIVAFVCRLQRMSPDQYKQQAAARGAGEQHDGDHR